MCSFSYVKVRPRINKERMSSSFRMVLRPIENVVITSKKARLDSLSMRDLCLQNK